MKKNQILYLLLFVVTISFMAGCKKKDEPTPPSRAELLAGTSASGKAWKVTAATASSIDVLTLAFPDACDRDNLFVFYTDKKLVIDEGASKCDSSDPQTVANGTWSLSADGNTLTIDSGGGSILTGNLTITEISSSTIKGTFPFTYMGTPLNVNVTLTAQ